MWHLACDIGQRYFRKTIPRAVLTSSGGLGGREKIPHAIKVANEQLLRLINYCVSNSCRLVVLSSMGQAAVKSAKSIKTQVLITDVTRLLQFIGFSKDEWEPRLSMAPRVVFKPLAEQPLAKIKRLEKIKINGRTIKATLLETGDIRLHLHLVNVPKLEISENGSQIDPATIGVSNVNLQDAAGSYAYHIPQGILLDYQPNVRTSSKRNKNTWQHCSVLDVAPSLLKLYGIEKPSFMKGIMDFSHDFAKKVCSVCGKRLRVSLSPITMTIFRGQIYFRQRI